MKIFSKMLDFWFLGQSQKHIPPLFRVDFVAGFKDALALQDRSMRKKLLVDMKVRMDSTINSDSQERRRKCIEKYHEDVKSIKKSIMAPTLKMAVPSIDFTVLDEKANAKLAIMQKKQNLESSVDVMKQTLATIPRITQKDKMAVYFLLLFSFVVNFFFFQFFLGDFVGGSTNISIIAIIFLAIILVIAEVLGPQMMFTACPENLAISLAKWTTIVGGVMIVLGVIVLFLGRGELTQAVAPVTNVMVK